MSLKDQLAKILAGQPDNQKAAEQIYAGSKPLAIYCIGLGVERSRAVERRSTRRELKREIKPRFQRGKVTGSAVFTPATKKRVVELSARVFTEWKIDAHITLGNATREELLAKAANERASSKGHIRNAMFYEAIAEPMQPGQRAMDFWKSKEDVVKIKDRIWRDTEHQTPALA